MYWDTERAVSHNKGISEWNKRLGERERQRQRQLEHIHKILSRGPYLIASFI